MKYLWLALFVLFVGVASYLAEEIFFPLRVPFAANTPEAMIYADFKELNAQKTLPSELRDIHEVYFVDHRLKKREIQWQQLAHFYFPRTPKGKFNLQIEAFDSATDTRSQSQEDLSIFQFGLFERNSKNKVWEMSRTYSFTEKQSQTR